MKEKIKIIIPLGIVVLVAWFALFKEKPLSQKMKCEIVAVYQVPGGAWATCLKLEDGSRIIWADQKLGNEGDKFTVWQKGNTQYLQNPNL